MSFSEWKYTTLGEIYTFSSGLSKNAKEFGFGSPFLSFKTVFNNYFVPDILDEFVNSCEKEQDKYSVKSGDIFLTRTSEILEELGMSCVALKDSPRATFNGFTKRLRPKKAGVIDPKFAGYYFRSTKFRNSITSMASLTTRASLNNDMLSRLPISIPPIEEQKGIADVLYSLDQKIEINKNIIRSLEKIIEATYKSWFIDFDTFQEDELDDTEIGKMPIGWRVIELGEIVEEIKDKVKTDILPVLSAVKTGQLVLSEEYFTKQVFSKNISKYVRVEPYEFAYNPARINIGSIGMNEFGYSGCVSPVYVAFRTNPKYQWFLKMFIKTERFNKEVSTRASGSVRQTLNFTEFCKIRLICPYGNNNILDKFNSVFESLYKIQNEVAKEIGTLISIRDELLPKLMSGEVRIPIEEVQ